MQSNRFSLSLAHWGGVFLVAVFCNASAVQAQNLGRGQSVMDRARPEYDAAGIRLGSFVGYPAFGVSIGYDENILAEGSSEQNDTLLLLDPSLLLESDWSRHSLSLAARSSSALYKDESDEERTDWGVAANGRLDLLESTALNTSLSFQNLTEDRGAIDAIQIVRKPTEYDQIDVIGSLTHRFNRLSVSIGGGYTKLDYEDSPRIGGGTVDQDFRDRVIVTSIGELAYAFAPGFDVFARGTLNDRDYDKSPLVPGSERDSDGYELVGGISSGISNLVVGELHVGYLDQDYDGSAFRDVDGFSFGLDLEWSVTELTAIRATASRSVVDATTAGAGGILSSEAGIGVDHELRRNLLLSGDLSYSEGDFKGVDREDRLRSATLELKYLLNRNVHLHLRYRFDDRDSDAANLDYHRNRLTLGVQFQLSGLR